MVLLFPHADQLCLPIYPRKLTQILSSHRSEVQDLHMLCYCFSTKSSVALLGSKIYKAENFSAWSPYNQYKVAGQRQDNSNKHSDSERGRMERAVICLWSLNPVRQTLLGSPALVSEMFFA